jgi:hypothetical protein
MLFSINTQKWTELAKIGAGYPIALVGGREDRGRSCRRPMRPIMWLIAAWLLLSALGRINPPMLARNDPLGVARDAI